MFDKCFSDGKTHASTIKWKKKGPEPDQIWPSLYSESGSLSPNHQFYSLVLTKIKLH